MTLRWRKTDSNSRSPRISYNGFETTTFERFITFFAVVKRSEIRTANSVRASLLKPCRPDRRSAAGDIIVRAGIAGAGDVPRPGSSIFSPRPIRHKKTRAWLTTAPRVASSPGRAAPYREPADSSRPTLQADRRRRDTRAMPASDFEFYKEFCKWIKICCKWFLTLNILVSGMCLSELIWIPRWGAHLYRRPW